MGSGGRTARSGLVTAGHESQAVGLVCGAQIEHVDEDAEDDD